MNEQRKSNRVKFNFGKAFAFVLHVWITCLFGLYGCGRQGQSLEEMLAQEQIYASTDGELSEAAYEKDDLDHVTQEVVKEQSASEQEAVKEQSASEQETGGEIQTLWVHICGYVQTPGIYELPVKSRIYDCLMAAGGFAQGADETALNLADYLQDGSQIYVPALAQTEGENTRAVVTASGAATTLDASGSRGELSQETNRININTATQQQLVTLPGIGEKRAKDIIAYRESYGPFESIEDIQKISGIKTAVYAKIKDLITVGN